jgi:hypothetical protein
MNGKSTRRALLRRGMKAGLGFGALSGPMQTRSTEKAGAEYEGFGTCLLLKDEECVADCQTAYGNCLRRNRASVCDSQHRTCEASCHYAKCYPDDDAGEGVLT